MNVATYFRVSTTEQNIDLQRDAVSALCARHPDWQITEYVDHGISGAKDSRPALNRMLADCRRGKIDRVIVWRYDRFARSVSHLLRALEEFRSLNVDFVSICESVDTSTPMGKLLFVILAGVSEMERSLIQARVVAGQQAARARGVRFGRPSVITKETAAQIAAMRQRGASERTIASQFGLSNATVHRVIAATA